MILAPGDSDSSVEGGSIDHNSHIKTIDQAISNVLSIIPNLNLSELYDLRDRLKNIGDALKCTSGSTLTPTEIISQTIVKIALLQARDRLIRSTEKRITFLKKESAYPTHAEVDDRYIDDNIPRSFPEVWTQRRWRSIWHNHRKTMNNRRHKERIAMWSREREEEEMKILKEGLLSRMLITLEGIRITREENIRRIEIETATKIATKIRDEAKENKAVLGFYEYCPAFLDAELYFALEYNLWRKSQEHGTKKKNKRFYDEVVAKIQQELDKRGLAYDSRDIIRAGCSGMSEQDRLTFINQVIL